VELFGVDAGALYQPILEKNEFHAGKSSFWQMGGCDKGILVMSRK
jgi:hypothetical protein